MKLSVVIPCYNELKTINGKLWDAEDIIRDCEQRQDFSESFRF